MQISSFIYNIFNTNAHVKIYNNFQRKNVNNFLPIILTYVLGAQKIRLIETIPLRIHNICFGSEIRKLHFRYALLTLKAPRKSASESIVCWSPLLQTIA